MVKIYQNTFSYEHPWDNVSLAFWLRYPNPFASHVLGADVLDRHVDSEGCLHTTRILLKKGVLPRWGSKIMKNNEAFIIEESVINPHTNTMTTCTKNLNHTRIMQVEETQTFKPHPDHAQWTKVTTEARIISNLGWGLTGKLEGFGVKKFADNTVKSRKGMSYVLEMIREKQLLRGRMFM
ncbi:MSF1-domain-containing protein [Basidiobolus meristosporus CBS 931.73]|uniref:MSF1-domain-containing protein n=1 Tax=Basidiobolus meristosporus CBS 931.73 TaxID=1314790 RepID=A0A1Y1Z7Z4_9FUNG|nr:MSF1-domain-containing protein [Basidiobolus meristosporus CBS 931.73]|eukprot:ORY06326.1 MSF1-domain-containing protein [Basidiobolus meristosporus CBS 931.73]